MQTDVLKDYD